MQKLGDVKFLKGLTSDKPKTSKEKVIQENMTTATVSHWTGHSSAYPKQRASQHTSWIWHVSRIQQNVESGSSDRGYSS